MTDQPVFDPISKRHLEVLDSSMAVVDVGSGRSILFLHGNPTSSYLWRKVIPPLLGFGRCVAPDLIGMGDSGKLDSDYRLAIHRRYLDQLIEALDLGDEIVMVAHDWGGPLAFDWSRRHPGRVAAIAFMEALVTPLSWDDWPEASRRIFQGMRSEIGEELVLEKNVFVERILPASVLEPLSPEVMDVYRRPYLDAGDSRRPTLTWPRELPIDGHPADVVEVIEANREWLESSTVPKLFVNARPGAVLVGRQREVVRAWPELTEVTVDGIHFIQEDSGREIGEAIAGWLAGL